MWLKVWQWFAFSFDYVNQNFLLTKLVLFCNCYFTAILSNNQFQIRLLKRLNLCLYFIIYLKIKPLTCRKSSENAYSNLQTWARYIRTVLSDVLRRPDLQINLLLRVLLFCGMLYSHSRDRGSILFANYKYSEYALFSSHRILYTM